MVDAQRDELAMVVGQTKLTTLAMVDVPWRNFSKSRVWNKVPEGSALIFDDIRVPIQHTIGQAEGSLYANN